MKSAISSKTDYSDHMIFADKKMFSVELSDGIEAVNVIEIHTESTA